MDTPQDTSFLEAQGIHVAPPWQFSVLLLLNLDISPWTVSSVVDSLGPLPTYLSQCLFPLSHHLVFFPWPPKVTVS